MTKLGDHEIETLKRRCRGMTGRSIAMHVDMVLAMIQEIQENRRRGSVVDAVGVDPRPPLKPLTGKISVMEPGRSKAVGAQVVRRRI